jgi:hypothetical protein
VLSFYSIGGFFVFTLTIDQTKVLEAIRYFCEKFEQAFPSVPKIAAMAGMCTRKCSDHIRELVELGRLIRIKRWNKSNMYQIVDPEPVQEEPPAAPQEERAVYKNLNNNFNKQDDDYKITHANQLDFVQLAQRMGMTVHVLKKIFPRIKQDLIDCNYFAMRTAIHQYLMHQNDISYIPAWFKEVLNDWKLRLRKDSAPART